MRIIGIDPGAQSTGFGLIEAQYNTLRFLRAGELKPPRSQPLPQRLKFLHDGLADLLGQEMPAVLAMEECFFGRHARAALVLGHARGALMVAALARAIPVYEYAPRLVKLAVTGVGSARKEQVQIMVPRLLKGAPEGLGTDASDALAVAICHAHRMSLPASGEMTLGSLRTRSSRMGRQG